MTNVLRKKVRGRPETAIFRYAHQHLAGLFHFRHEALVLHLKTNQKTLRQQEYVKESLTRAFDELKRAQQGEHKMMTDEEFIAELKAEGIA